MLSAGSIKDVAGAVSFNDGNITNVGSIALDSIAADDGSSFAFSNNWTAAGRTCANLGTVTTADIDGGSIDGTNIGAGTKGTGAFTTLIASGDVDLGDATSDTITVAGRFDSDLIPSSDNARDLGASSAEWKDLYLDGTANIDSLVADTAAINGGSIDGVTIGTNTAATQLQVDNININANTISSTDTDGHLIIQPNGGGNVELQTDTVDIGTGTENKYITTSGTGWLKLNTNGGSSTSEIVIQHHASDANQNHIDINPNGSSNIKMFGGGGSGDLTLSDNDISGVGTVTATSFVGNLTGNASGTAGSATNATNATNVTVTDNEDENEENLIAFVADAATSTGNHGLEMDGNLTYNPSSGLLTLTQIDSKGKAGSRNFCCRSRSRECSWGRRD